MADYYSILTDAGKKKLTAALTNKKPLVFAKMAAGDGSGAQYTVTSALTKLKNEKWRGDIRDVRLSEASEYQAAVEAIIPVEVGNFWIREIGLFDDAGTLIAIANYPDTFKPPLQSGVGKQIIIQLLITVQDQAAVTLIVSDNVNYATKAELNGFLKTSNNLSEIKTAGTAAQQAARTNLAIPDGTTAVKGMLQLYNGVDSASTVYAATAAAVKVANDKAVAAQTAANTAKSTADTAKSEASTAKSTADTAKSMADSALAKASATQTNGITDIRLGSTIAIQNSGWGTSSRYDMTNGFISRVTTAEGRVASCDGRPIQFYSNGQWKTVSSV